MSRTVAIVIAFTGAALASVTACSGGGDGGVPFDFDDAPLDGGSTTSTSSSGTNSSSGTTSSSGASSSGGSSGSTTSSGGSSGNPLASCINGVKDGSETDIDCGGGGACDPCTLGKKCNFDSDCATLACNGVCVPKPSLTGVSPACATIAGGSTLTLTGANFANKTGWGVTIGGVAATSPTYFSPTKLTAVTPAAGAGTVAVSVTGMPGGTLTLNNAFTYGQSNAATPTFGTAITSGYSNQTAIAVGDVNGDGKIDYIQDHGGSHLDLLINQGSNSFSLTANSATRSSVKRMVMADFNGDGKSDLAMTVGSAMAISLSTGTTFGSYTDYTATTNVYAVLAVDLNGDNKPEVVTLDNATDTLSVFVNKGDGTFDAKVDYTVPKGTTLATGDFNNDGKKDIVASSSATNAVTLLLGNGDGTLGTATALALDAPSGGIAVGDFDGDTKIDIVAGNGANLSVLSGNANGTFNAKVNHSITTGGTAPASVRVADFDGDGIADLAVLNTGSNQVEIWTSKCGTTLSASGVTFAVTGGTDLWVADLSGDGKVDVLYGSTNNNPRYNPLQ